MTRAGAVARTLLLGLALLTSGVALQAQTVGPEPPLEELKTPEPPRAEPVKRLRLMLLDLADLRLPEPPSAGFDPPAGPYRHTFGSQRHTVVEDAATPILFRPEAVEADVVVLANLIDIRAARRLFPARDWRLLTTRIPLAEAKAAADPRTAKKALPAVAMWLQPGVRFGGADPGLPPGVGASLRMTSGLGSLWTLSPAIACPTANVKDSAKGEVCLGLEGWLGPKVAAGDLALVGGLLPSPPPAAAGKPAKPVSQATPAAASPPANQPRAAPPTALPLLPRRLDDRVLLTAADAADRCGGNAAARPALLLSGKDITTKLKIAGYVLPIPRPKPPSDPDSRTPPAPLPPACALILDIEAAQ